MARKRKAQESIPFPSLNDEQRSTEDLEENVDGPPTSIDPYMTLSLEKTATADQVKSAYRKAALKHHPDKVPESEKDAAHRKFQEVAFAYAILGDEKRRKRYDATGNTTESLEDDDNFDWVDLFRAQSEAVIDGSVLDNMKAAYQDSEEERQDVLKAFEDGKGDMDVVYESVMMSNVIHDDERFRSYINSAIEKGEVEAYRDYKKETNKSRETRVKRAQAEEAEAMELAEELGVKDKLFGSKAANRGSKKEGKKANGDGEDALKSLIQQRQMNRAESFLDGLEAKYGGGVGKKGGKRKIQVDEPPEEKFQKNAKKVKRKA